MTLLAALLIIFALAAILIGARALNEYLDRLMGYQPKASRTDTTAKAAAKPTTNNRMRFQ